MRLSNVPIPNPDHNESIAQCNRQTFDSGWGGVVAMFGYFALLLTIIASFAAMADSDAVVDQCRNQSLDASGFNECLTLLEQESEAALNVVEAGWVETLQSAADSQAGEADQGDWQKTRDTLVNTRTTFQQYRDSHCGFLSAELDGALALTELIACKTAMNQSRTQTLQRLLVERKARATHGTFFRGFYLPTTQGGLFQSCDIRRDWSLQADEELLARMDERYQQVTSDNLEMVYLEFRGKLEDSSDPAVPGTVLVSQLNLLRPILDRDCRYDSERVPLDDAQEQEPVSTPAAEAESTLADTSVANTIAAADTTIDTLGGSGFLYGYFGNWISQCAAQMPQVCKTQTTDSFSTGGDWQLLLDRSASGLWRVRIMPTTDSHVIASQLQISLDDQALFSVPVDSRQILAGNTQTIASGQNALTLLNGIRSGNSLAISWNSSGGTRAQLAFSLAGATRALQYFDSRVN